MIPPIEADSFVAQVSPREQRVLGLVQVGVLQD